MRRIGLIFPAFCALASLSRDASADEPTPPSLPVVHSAYWRTPPERAFTSATIDAGYLYLRPRLSLGYGKPFTQWVGIDINPIATTNGVGVYGGIRLQVPWFDFRAGARGFRSFQHNYLLPQAGYETTDLNTTIGDVAHYVTLETELSGGIPAGPGSILFVLTASSIHGVPVGELVYEETLRVIVAPPTVYRARTGYALRVGSEGNARVGVVGEVLDLPERSAFVYRAGLIASFAISDHLETLGLLVFPIKSPDSIGIAGGDFAELGIRYRWASGQSEP